MLYALRIRRITTRRIISCCFNYPGTNNIHRNVRLHRSSCNRPRLPFQSSKMALRQGAWPSLPLLAPLSILWQPRASAPSALTVSRQLTSKMLIQLAIPISVSLTIPPILFGIWESILRAVPKKKTSHRKKRQRFMAGNALKDVTSLNKCSACGNVKRAHLLCPYCVKGRLRCSSPDDQFTLLTQTCP